MTNCKNLLLRSKNYTKYYYCKLNKKQITLSQCINCPLIERNTLKVYKYTIKNKSVLKEIKKPLNKVSKKREFVTKETYNSVFERDKGQCQICGSRINLHLHHICSRGKDKTNNVELCIMLCNECHLNIVHKNNKYWRPKLLDIIANKKD